MIVAFLSGFKLHKRMQIILLYSFADAVQKEFYVPQAYTDPLESGSLQDHTVSILQPYI